ncbi:hypothetical protein ONZ45_g4098 [Pleurotus djamor]|nr:hypothetical protein ONZ45_g4098 [Pleurotus djamor]
MFRGRVLSALGPPERQGTKILKRSQNLRRVVRTKRPRLASETEEATEAIPEWSPNDELEGWEVEEHNHLVDEDANIVPANLRKRYVSSDNPMSDWMQHREEFLFELLKGEAQTKEGRAGRCLSCLERQDSSAGGETVVEGTEPLFRCRECTWGANECQRCCLERHAHLPLHRIEKWNGDSFQKITLREMGLRVQLGHGGSHCPVPEAAAKSFTVIHTNGLHTVAVDYCNCDKRVARTSQLFQARWYPATVKFPATCATLEMIQHFHGLSLCSKVSAHEYYRNLERLTTNLRVDVPKNRYQAFLRVIRQYRHLRMLKRAGRAHVKDGVAKTGKGELALRCLACARPGVNLPADWWKVDPAMRFLYMVFVSLDANFRLKNRLRKSDKIDPGLHTGLAYFVPPKSYNEHVLKHATEADISTCSSFGAMAHADSKSTTGLRYTGVGMCVCLRHEMVQPLGVGDLQKGERYCNMDYVLLSALLGFALATSIMVIYDIACQWKVNLPARIAEFPAEFRLPATTALDFAIPKCHSPAHKTECQAPHSLNLKPGAGRTDGEGIERDWSMINPAANSTREMGQGSRHDTLDDLFAFHNWQKITGLGQSLKRKYFLAVVEARRNKDLHDDFNQSIPEEVRASWTKMILEWDVDSSKPNPYEIRVDHESENDVKKKLLAAECRDSALGRMNHDKTETSFLSMGLVVEESQRRLRLDNTSKLTSIQASQLHERRLVITKQIKAFRKAQQLKRSSFALPNARIPWNVSASTNVHDGRLPSISTSTPRVSVTAPELERTSIEYLSREIKQLKNTAMHDQRWYRLWEKARFQATYEFYTTRMFVLPPVFSIDHIQPPRNMREASTRLGEGYREVPWIWRVAGSLIAEDTGAMNAGLRVEWAKSRARALRWQEEVLLVKEEMRRVRLSLQHEADEWRKRQASSPTITTDPDLSQGLSAYAHRQILVRETLRNAFTSMWERPPGKRSKLAQSLGTIPSAPTDDARIQQEMMATMGIEGEEEEEEEEEEEVLEEAASSDEEEDGEDAADDADDADADEGEPDSDED